MIEQSVFPWGDNHPTVRQRVLVAGIIAVTAASMHWFRGGVSGGASDFSMLWYGAKALLAGDNPYALIGPGRQIDLPSTLFYPAPALAAVIPFTVIPYEIAGALFVLISAWLLAFGATKDGWQLLPIFPSVVFLSTARLGQWSILITASLFIPSLAFFAIAKPQGFLPVILSSRKRGTWIASAIGAIALLAISFMLFPHWVEAWWAQLGTTDYFSAPIASWRGIAIATLILRWRRSDAWLVLVAACMPQTWYPYNGLILLCVATTYREASVLSLLSSAGWFAAFLFLSAGFRSPETRVGFESILIALGYLPATILVLRRSNTGPGPAWLERLRKT
jgi:hypothetical protein